MVFLPNFNVTNGQRVYPAADLSEQISTAGKEASGTGNMKFCMNGALTIGTLDGANIEMREEIGAENFFLFGLTASGGACPQDRRLSAHGLLSGNQHLKEIVDLIRGGYFSQGDTELFRPLMDNLMYHDPYMLFADFASYVAARRKVSEVYRDAEIWTRMAILNTARSGRFSSDRTIREYCSEIWRVRPVPIRLLNERKQEAHRSAQRLRRPHRSWSPTVKAERNSPPIAILRSRPMGMAGVPETAAGASSPDRGLALIGTTFDQCIAARNDGFDFLERDIVCELDGGRLGMAAHGAHPHADAFHRHRGRLGAHDLVRFGPRLPFLAAAPVARSLWITR